MNGGRLNELSRGVRILPWRLAFLYIPINETALLSCYHLDGSAYNIEIYYEVRPMRVSIYLLHHIHQLHLRYVVASFVIKPPPRVKIERGVVYVALLNRLFFVVLPFSFCFSASRRLRKNLQEFVLRQRYIVVRQEGSYTPSFERLDSSHFLVVLLASLWVISLWVQILRYLLGNGGEVVWSMVC